MVSMRFVWLCALVALGALAQVRAEVVVPRLSPLPVKVETERVPLSGTWTFNGGDPIEVPGEWVMQGFEVEKGREATYERTFDVPRSWRGQRVKLRCNGIYSRARIEVNGKAVGSHLGGFTAFELDVTDAVRPGGENRIRIGVTSETVADATSNASNYAAHPLGGITRDLYLFALPEVNVASFHVQTTFDDQYTDAVLRAEVEVADESAGTSAGDLALRFVLKDPEGRKVFDVRKPARVGSQSFDFDVERPAQWTAETPTLYDLACTIERGGRALYTTRRRVGFRQIEVRGNQLFVNNRPVKLRGVCRHEVMPLRGRSLVEGMWRRDVELFREGNVNYIRTSHYPPDEALLEACDELGMYVEVEAPFCWMHQATIAPTDSAVLVDQHIEMVHLNRSHPSVLIWSLGNESLKYKECFTRAAEVVKELDPTRPRNFSQWSPDADGNELEIGNHHYPGPGGPDQYRGAKRPIVFDEFCHLNSYNRLELSADPGIRDQWGELLDRMWTGMYHSQGVLGGAIWVGIDDTFFLPPDGRAVGYGTWGVIDGWRRKKPEFWGMKKAYSPVRLKLKGNLNAEGRLSFAAENRHDFLDFSACRFEWSTEGRRGEVSWSLAARRDSVLTLTLPESVREGADTLHLDVFSPQGFLVDAYCFSLRPEATSLSEPAAGELTLDETDEAICVRSKGGKFVVSKRDGLLDGLEPALMVLPLNNEGRGIQMVGGGQDFDPYTPTCSDWVATAVRTCRYADRIEVSVDGEYKEAQGTLTYRFLATGETELDYDFTMKEAVSPRQVGLTFALPADHTRLTWKRRGYWNYYPADHIAALTGTADYMREDIPVCGLAGPDKEPTVPWELDQTEYGSNAFRSTKVNVYRARLESPATGRGFTVQSDGRQSVRCWREGDGFRLLVADYVNAGKGQYIEPHAALDYRPLRRGDRIRGRVAFRWEANGANEANRADGLRAVAHYSH